MLRFENLRATPPFKRSAALLLAVYCRLGLIALGYPALRGFFWTLVPCVRLPLRKFQVRRAQIFVRDLAKKVSDAIEACTLLVVCIHDVPGGSLEVRVLEHDVFCAGILDPS